MTWRGLCSPIKQQNNENEAASSFRIAYWDLGSLCTFFHSINIFNTKHLPLAEDIRLPPTTQHLRLQKCTQFCPVAMPFWHTHWACWHVWHLLASCQPCSWTIVPMQSCKRLRFLCKLPFFFVGNVYFWLKTNSIKMQEKCCRLQCVAWEIRLGLLDVWSASWFDQPVQLERKGTVPVPDRRIQNGSERTESGRTVGQDFAAWRKCRTRFQEHEH